MTSLDLTVITGIIVDDGLGLFGRSVLTKIPTNTGILVYRIYNRI